MVFDNVSLAQHHSVIEWHQFVFSCLRATLSPAVFHPQRGVKQLLRNIAFVSEQLAIQPFSKNLNTFGSLSLTFAPVSTNAIISPLSLHARWSLKPWHQPIVPFPSVAIPLKTLLAYLLRLWHTGIIVESTNVMPVHLPKAPRLRKNMSWKNTRLSNSTKRLYDTVFENKIIKCP